jgi:hypothetical protein
MRAGPWFGDAATAEIVYRQLLSFRPDPGALGTSTVFFMGTIRRNLGGLAEVFGDRAEMPEAAAPAQDALDIATRLVLSDRTVESHVRSILAKTQCANRTEFVARWNPP